MRDFTDAVDGEDEIGISSRRSDGSLRPFITIWAVTVGGAVYVRSAYGADNGWYRRALVSGTGAIRVADTEYAVAFTPADADTDQAAIDTSYLSKYARYPGIVKGIVGEDMHALTLRLDEV